MYQIKTFLNVSAVALVLLSLTMIFTNCSNTSRDSGAGNKTTAVHAWDAPVGELIQGATLADGWGDLREVPSPVNISGGWTDSVAVTSDGMSLLFGYSRLDFPTFFDSLKTGTPIFNYNGPVRSGMTGDKFKMFRADLGSTGWNVSFQPFNGDPNIDEASASTNVNQDIVVFTRFDGNGVGDLYYVIKTAGAWSAPVAFPTSPSINTNCKDDNAFVVGSISTGATLYFESNRIDLAGTACDNSGANQHIYFSVYSPANGGSFSAVQKMNDINGINNGDDDTQVFFSPDRSSVYWTALRAGTAYGIFTADLSGNNYINIRQIVTPNFASPFAGKLALIGEANVAETPEGWLMYMMCGIARNESGGKASDIELKVCRARKPR